METVDVAIGQAEDAIWFCFDAITIGMIRWDGIGWGGHGDRTEGDAALGRVIPVAGGGNGGGSIGGGGMGGELVSWEEWSLWLLSPPRAANFRLIGSWVGWAVRAAATATEWITVSCRCWRGCCRLLGASQLGVAVVDVPQGPEQLGSEPTFEPK